ncbi:MAG: hypothetical protein ACRC8M_02855 [Cetobacterium sp.]|uniref:hypothetical protein n=1 Tax=Cetobacterium sp. TaxID=2071632 RepID=UPI003F41A8EE
MKKIWLTLILIMSSLLGCKSLEEKKENSIKINLIGNIVPKDNLTVLLFAYDNRIADKKADLVRKESIVLKEHENIIEFIVPKDTRTYYISLDNKETYSLDYSSGSIQNLEFTQVNNIKVNKK